MDGKEVFSLLWICDLIIKFLKNNANIIKSEKPDLIVILGDRSELFSISIPAMLNSIPLLHLYGGDKTQGCTDESTRHAITMLSNYHVVSNNRSKKKKIYFGVLTTNRLKGTIFRTSRPCFHCLQHSFNECLRKGYIIKRYYFFNESNELDYYTTKEIKEIIDRKR